MLHLASLYKAFHGERPSMLVGHIVEASLFIANDDEFVSEAAIPTDIVTVVKKDNVIGVALPRVFLLNKHLLQEINTIFSTIPNPIICVDLQGTIKVCNNAMEKIFQHRQTLIGKHIQEFILHSQFINITQTGETHRWGKTPNC